MKKVFFLLALNVIATFIIAQTNLPNVRDVVKEFYETYNTNELEYEKVQFEKKKDGWYVVTQKIKDRSLIPDNSFMFYKKDDKVFQTLEITKHENRKTIKPDNYVHEYDLYNYDLQICFGYNGWYKDVIAELELKKELTDDELYGLGRAYSTLANSFISQYTGFGVPEDLWELPYAPNCLSVIQIEHFLSIGNKGVACFKQLAKRTPGYETAVGAIGVKHANEIMFLFQVLYTYASDYAEKMVLPDSLYTKDQLAVSRRNLESCPKEAILLSFGDNDYYPVLYLQKNASLRTDIYLINYSLIGVDKYIFRTGFKQFNAKPINMSLDKSIYGSDKVELILIRDKDSVFQISDIKRLFNLNDNASSYPQIFANELSITNNSEKETERTIRDKKIFPIENARYLIKNQWILLDILEHLKGRKVCFQNNFYDELNGLNSLLTPLDDLFVF